jgi:acetyl esterase/lipase
MPCVRRLHEWRTERLRADEAFAAARTATAKDKEMMKLRSCALLSLIWAQFATASLLLAQTSNQPAPQEAGRPAPIGNMDQLIEHYAPLQEKAPYDGINVTRDVRYGPAERNLADIFTPATPDSAPRPVLLFVHGGGFTAGERQLRPGLPIYDNIAVWAVRHGFIGVNMTYRLAPQFKWPAGAEDVGLAVRYLIANIANEGGDPHNIFLMGHSAGAVHAAAYLSHPELQGSTGPGVSGAILVSGALDITSLAFGDRERAYFGLDASKYEEQSSLRGLVASSVPLLIANAERDPPMFLQQASELKKALLDANRQSVTTLILDGHTHMSTVMAINTNDTALSSAIETFINDKSKRGP